MVSSQNVSAQLKKIGVSVKYWGAGEVRELQHILMTNEEVVALINGRYENGFATLVATDQRLLLIDKKPLYLTIEDLRYDTVAEIDYNARLLDSTVRVMTFNKALAFTSIRQKRLRACATYVQQRVMELRHHQFDNQFQSRPDKESDEAQIAWIPQAEGAATQETETPMQWRVPNPYTRSSVTMRQHFLPKIRRTRY